MACAYLLSLYVSSSAPLPTSLCDRISEWSLIGDNEGLQTPSANTCIEFPVTTDRLPAGSVSVPSGADLSRVSSEPATNTLEKVLDLHASRRMKPSLHHSRYQKPKMGVSIPSQQRWLSYWSQILAGKGPSSLRLSPANEGLGDQERVLHETSQSPKVRLTKLTVRMGEPSRMQPHFVQAASAVITSTGKRRAVGESTVGRLWASVARYSDRLIDELEHWENESRSSGGITETSPFRTDRLDKVKMIRSFAQMSISDIQPAQEGDSVCTITPLYDLL